MEDPDAHQPTRGSAMRFLPFVLLLSSATAAQDVHVVDQGNGPGTDFTSLAPAIAAAADGDLLLVRAGFYVEDVVLDGKGLRLVADSGAVVAVQSLTVRNLSASQAASIRGIGRLGLSQSLVLAQNLGAVWIEESSVPIGPFVLADAVIDGCSAVEIRNANFVLFAGSAGDRSLSVSASSVAFHGCSIVGPRASNEFTPGGIGVAIGNSQVDFYDCSIVGGAGANQTFLGPTAGGAGIQASGTAAVRLVATTVAGGQGGTGPGSSAADGPAFSITAPATVTTLAGNAHRLTTERVVREGQSTSITLEGDPGDRAFVRISSAQSAPVHFPGVVGALVTAFPASSIAFGVLPSGAQTFALTAPLLPPGLLTSSVHVQPLFFGGGETALGSPSLVQLLDSSL